MTLERVLKELWDTCPEDIIYRYKDEYFLYDHTTDDRGVYPIIVQNSKVYLDDPLPDGHVVTRNIEAKFHRDHP